MIASEAVKMIIIAPIVEIKTADRMNRLSALENNGNKEPLDMNGRIIRTRAAGQNATMAVNRRKSIIIPNIMRRNRVVRNSNSERKRTAKDRETINPISKYSGSQKSQLGSSNGIIHSFNTRQCCIHPFSYQRCQVTSPSTIPGAVMAPTRIVTQRQKPF